VPVAALLVAERRVRQVASELGLERPRGRTALLRAAALAAVLLLLGLAVARPALRTTEGRPARTDAHAFFVLDVSRSMLASAGPGAPTRLERAKAAAVRLRAAVPEVPAGVAGFTDRVLPYVFPTSDPSVFPAVLEQSVDVDAPPPREVLSLATSFDALADLQRRGFFTRQARTRLCVVLTDGESRPPATDDLAQALLASPPCRLLVVRVGNAGERIFGRGGRPESQYRPRETAASAVEALVAATGGRAFGEADVAEAARALETLAGSGPTASAGTAARTTELAPFLALAAAALVLALALGPLLAEIIFARAQRTDYDAVENQA
jgi:von Willebrand factor type A domain